MELRGVHIDPADLIVGDFPGIDFVIQVVLALDVHRAGFELKVDILGDEGDLAVSVVLPEQKTGGEDAVINALAVGENAVELLELL